MYQEIADTLRTEIHNGTYPPNSTLPHLTVLATRFTAATGTVRQAIKVLADEGLVEPIRRRGTIVRGALRRHLVVRSRTVYRDDRGYFFDLAAQDWIAIETPEIRSAPPPPDIAELLGVEPGRVVVTRDRVIGDPHTRAPRQLAISYLPPWLVNQLPVLGQADTGPGGIYDRIEEAGLGPLVWDERIGARAASGRDRGLWSLAPGTPVLRIVRLARGGARQVCEVNETTMPADRYEVGYTLARAEPATDPTVAK
jgi:GntR family transcriptional regulator